ncbi:MAG: VCBS repeat-containing protein, partial [Candidatus Eisenbacteria bacterium]|nr:VCBS repeat-containing protein [Candidatus Eisenbacteria bacterium]
YSNGNYFSLFNGTSSATPHAAGVAALIWSYKPSLTNTEVWNLMRNTAEDLGSVGWDIWTGWGRINAANAIESMLFSDATVDPLGSSDSGAGVAWGDYDGDGDPDLYLSRRDAPNQLFRNDAGTFVDATTAPLGGVGGGQGAVWGDYDNDGDLDLYLGNNGADQLLRNDNGTFSDVTQGALSDNSHTTGVNWVDYDNDGDLDLYRSNYDDANRLLRNDGGAGFVEVPSTPLNNSLPTVCSAWADYDNDGDQDVYFTNEGANRMVRNNGDGTFSGASSAPLNDANFGRGCAWGDFDNDGDLDLFLANVDAPSRLFRNNGGGSFTDVAAGPLAVPTGTIGCAWGDYDNDGDLDLFLSREGAPSHLMRNEGGYWSISQKSGILANSAIGRGCAWSDYDRDGDLDLYVANEGSSNRLIRNDRLSPPSWFEVRLVGSQTNRGAVGARVSVKADGLWRTREVSAGANYLSMNDATLHFGLAGASAIDSVTIRWTNSPEQHLTGVGLNQILAVNEGGGTVDAADLPPVPRLAEPRFVGAPSPNPFTSSSAIRFRLSAAGPASLRLYAADGRLVRTLLAGHADHGDYTLHWNGTADDGRPARAGIYFARLLQGDREVSERLVRLE